MGWFDGKKDIGKMSDDEKFSLLQELQTDFLQRNIWTEKWFEERGLACPAREEHEKQQLEVLKKEAEELQKAVADRKKELESLNNAVEEAKNKQRILWQSVQEEEHRLAELKETSQHVSMQELEKWKGEMQESMNRIIETLADKIDHENRELVRVLDKTEDKLMRKEADVQSFQEDSRLKATAPFLKQFIHLGDMMRKVLEDVPEHKDDVSEYLTGQIEKLTDSIDYILRDFSVDVFRHSPENTQFDPYTQQAFDYPTDNPELDKKVRRTLHPGYVWTLPYILKAKANGEEHPLKEYRMVFRREQVECYKYSQNKK